MRVTDDDTGTDDEVETTAEGGGGGGGTANGERGGSAFALIINWSCRVNGSGPNADSGSRNLSRPMLEPGGPGGLVKLPNKPIAAAAA